jgi:hypothetical protein
MGKRDSSIWKEETVAKVFKVTKLEMKKYQLIKIYNNLERINEVPDKRNYIYNTDLLKDYTLRTRNKLWNNYIQPYRNRLMNGIVRDTLQCLYQPTNKQYVNEMLD